MLALKKTLARTLVSGAIVMTAALGFTIAPPAMAAETGYTATKYPIVLVHGLLGFDSILNGFMDYWYKIVPDLRSGGAVVFVTEVSGVNSTEVRGEQLIQQIRYIMAATGAEKVNLIGHSHGSPTIRYVAAVMPEAVASVTSVAGLNTRGAKAADGISKTKPLGVITGTLMGGLARLIDFLSGKKNAPEDAVAALNSLSGAGLAEFNQKYPAGLPPENCSELHGPDQVNGIRYYSWTGNDIHTNRFDPLDNVFAMTSVIMHMADPDDQTANDGLVSVCASRLGRQIGIYKQNHLDEINLFYGLVSKDDVNPVVIYREHANRLMKLGL